MIALVLSFALGTAHARHPSVDVLELAVEAAGLDGSAVVREAAWIGTEAGWHVGRVPAFAAPGQPVHVFVVAETPGAPPQGAMLSLTLDGTSWQPHPPRAGGLQAGLPWAVFGPLSSPAPADGRFVVELTSGTTLTLDDQGAGYPMPVTPVAALQAVSAPVLDDSAGVAISALTGPQGPRVSAELLWRLDGVPQPRLAMWLDAIDVGVDQTRWRTELPLVPGGSVVEYVIRASAGGAARWSTQGGQPFVHTTTCDRPAAFDVGLSPTRFVHVSPTGSDTTGDGSAASPYRTLERAATDATPGTRIELAPGVHTPGQFLDDLQGLPTAPIWIGGGATRPILRGGNEGLHLTRPQWVVVHDLIVEDASSNGINVDDGGDTGDPLAAHHVVIRDVEIRDIGGNGNDDCLKLSGLRDFAILDSVFSHCGGGGSAIDHVGCHRGLVADNLISHDGSSGIQVKGASRDLELRGNRLTGPMARGLNLGGSTDLIYFRPPVDPSRANAEARDLRVIANVVEGAQAPVAFVGCVGCLVAHNTLIRPTSWTFRILQETTSTPTYTFEAARDGVVDNNLVVFRRADVSTDVNIGPDTLPATFSWTTNLFFAEDAPGASAPTLPGTEQGTLTGADPMLAADGSIPPGSPAAGVGTPGIGGGDFGGACWRDPPAIGAFEP